MDYRRTNHSKFLLMVPIVFVCKYRKHLLVRLNNKMKGILYRISDKSDFAILEMEVDKTMSLF